MPRESNVTAADTLAARLKAVADPARLRLIRIMAASDGIACECELAGPMRLSQPTLSYHLRVLRQAGLVERDSAKTAGRACAYYRLRPDAMSELARELADCSTQPDAGSTRISGVTGGGHPPKPCSATARRR